MLDVCLLGTGGMMPLKDRWLTSCYIEYYGKSVLIDCGEGTQIALAKSECKISRINLLLLTHCHADHIAGLPGFLLSLGNCSRTEPLTIYAPKGSRKVIESLMCVCGSLPFKLDIRELPVNNLTKFIADDIDSMLEIEVLPLRHSVPCLGYSLNFKRKPVFAPEKAKALDIPIKLWSKLHSGETITLNDGRTITTDMVTSGERKIIKITYTTDSLPFDDIASLAFRSDLFICEGMYGDESQKESLNEKKHMLMQDACYLANLADVDVLWLTHYSPAMQNPSIYVKQLSKLFARCVVSKDGQKLTI